MLSAGAQHDAGSTLTGLCRQPEPAGETSPALDRDASATYRAVTLGKSAATGWLTTDAVLSLQRTTGNAVFSRWLERSQAPRMSAKLTPGRAWLSRLDAPEGPPGNAASGEEVAKLVRAITGAAEASRPPAGAPTVTVGSTVTFFGVTLGVVGAAVGWVAFYARDATAWRRHFEEQARRIALADNLLADGLIDEEAKNRYILTGHLVITAARAERRRGGGAAGPGQESAISGPDRAGAHASEPAGAAPAPPEAAGSAPASRKRDKAAAARFLRRMLAMVRNYNDPKDPRAKHMLAFLLEETDGKAKRTWRKTTRETEAGAQQTGRYEGNERGPTVQVGHQGAHAAGIPEQFVLEDADLNQTSGNTIETPGAFSFKEAVIIGGVPVDVASALQWERLGLLPKGTVDGSMRVAPPMPPNPATSSGPR